MSSWRILRHLLNDDCLEILEHAVTKLGSERIAIVVLRHEAVAFVGVGSGSQVVLVIVVLHVALLGSLAVVHTGCKRGRDNAHLGYDTLDLDVLVEEVGFKCARGNIVLADGSLEIDIVVGNFRRELGVGLRLL